MPILARETDIFPENLFSRAELVVSSSTSEDVSRWWAVYTRSRQEKQLMRSLLTLAIPFYCPLVPHKYRSPAGRLRTSHLPLFTNYLFMHADGFNRYRALKTNLISKTIEVPSGQQLTDDLRQIHRLIESGLPLQAEDKLQPGRLVRIKSGPLVGVEGTILKRQGANYLFVVVNFLQQGATVKLEDHDIELLD